MSESLFGSGRDESFSSLILENKLAVVGVVTGSLLEILDGFDQPYEILICVLIVLIILMIVKTDLNHLVTTFTKNESEVWRIALVSYIDFIKAAIVMFTVQYITRLVTAEWKRVGYSKSDTIVVSVFFVFMFIGFLVFFTNKPKYSVQTIINKEK